MRRVRAGKGVRKERRRTKQKSSSLAPCLLECRHSGVLVSQLSLARCGEATDATLGAVCDTFSSLRCLPALAGVHMPGRHGSHFPNSLSATACELCTVDLQEIVSTCLSCSQALVLFRCRAAAGGWT